MLPDVDGRSWIETLERLVALDIEFLVEGHGLIHTERREYSRYPGCRHPSQPQGGARGKAALSQMARPWRIGRYGLGVRPTTQAIEGPPRSEHFRDGSSVSVAH
jgi:hypothetical protein